MRQRIADLEPVISGCKQTEQSLRLEEARLDALLHLSQMTKVSISEVAGFILEKSIALTQSKIGFVGFLNEDESIYTLHAVSKDAVKECTVEGNPIQLHITGAGIWADAIRQRRTLFVNDYSKPHPSKKGLPPGHPQVSKFMVVPLLDGEKIVTMAGVGNKPSDYDKSDERQITLLMRGMWNNVQENRSRQALQKAHDELEQRVRERTAELAALNATLKEEIIEHKMAEEEFTRLNRELRAISHCNQAIVRANDEQSLYKDVCRIMCEVVGYRMSWIGTVEQDEAKSVRPIAWYGDNSGYLQTANITWADTKHGRGPTGIAARTGKTDFCQDFTIEPKAAPWREGALARGFRSSIAIPLFDNDRSTFAVFSLYASKANGFTTQEVKLLEELSGDLAFGISVLRERTKRKQAEEALKHKTDELSRSNAELEQFAYVASHDLQEPLRMVASYVKLLAKRYEGKLDQDADDFIGYAHDGAVRMQRLINDLLEYSRVGTSGMKFEQTNLESVLAEALSNLKVNISESGAVITHHDPLPMVFGDSLQLVQVFQNLIDNAIKFRGNDMPRIHVSAGVNAGQCVCSVSDNGVGIDPDFFDKIFILFQRLHTRAEYPGTGIGLSFCKRIIERHGGRIWVESKPGAGSCFYFTLPVNARREQL